MSKIIMVFRLRMETNKFYSLLRTNRVQATIINTPKEAHLSCGISVMFDESRLKIAERLLLANKFNSFAGVFKQTPDRRELVKIS